MTDNRLLLTDILRGYSIASADTYKLFFIKHLNTFDFSYIDYIKEKHYNEAIENNIPPEEEKLQYLLQESLWSKDRESKLNELKYFLDGLKLTKAKLHLPSQVDAIKIEIEKAESDIAAILNEKRELLGLTAESYADKRSNEYFTWYSLFKDDKLKEKLVSEEDFDSLEEKDLYSLAAAYNDCISKFNTRSLKKIALAPYFLNLFYLCKNNPFTFYGKPVVDLTFFQIELFGHGMYFKSILQELKDKVAPEILKDPDRLIDYYDSSKNTEELLSKISNDDNPTATSIVGATKEDLQKLGLQPGEDKIAKELAKKGSLSMQDLIDMNMV